MVATFQSQASHGLSHTAIIVYFPLFCQKFTKKQKQNKKNHHAVLNETWKLVIETITQHLFVRINMLFTRKLTYNQIFWEPTKSTTAGH